MDDDTNAGRILKTTDTSIEIIELIQKRDGMRLTEIAEELGSSPSTVHAHLATLDKRGLVVKENGVYQLGLELLRYGEYARHHKEAYEVAKPKVKELGQETQLRSHFLVEQNGHAYYLCTYSGKYAVTTFARDGKRIPLHAPAAGKSILAHLPDERVEAIIDRHGLQTMTPNTIAEKDRLFDELKTVRERGFAFNDEETVEGVRAVGVPVTGKDDKVIGAFSVSGPVNRLIGEQYETELPNTLLGIANEFELEVTYS